MEEKGTNEYGRRAEGDMEKIQMEIDGRGKEENTDRIDKRK